MLCIFQKKVQEELLDVIKERDELKVALLDIEKQTEDIQNNVKALCNERDHFKTLYKQVSFTLIHPAGERFMCAKNHFDVTFCFVF